MFWSNLKEIREEGDALGRYLRNPPALRTRSNTPRICFHFQQIYQGSNKFPFFAPDVKTGSDRETEELHKRRASRVNGKPVQ